MAAIVMCGLYVVTFITAYEMLVAPVYAYGGLGDRPLPGWCWCVLFLLASAPAVFLELTLERVSALTSWLLYLSLIVPCCVVPALAADTEPGDAVAISASIVGSFIAFELMRSRRLFKLPALSFKFDIAHVIVPALVLLGSFLLLHVGGYRLDLQLGEAMYDRRMVARDIVQGEGFEAYALATLMGAGVPFVVAGAIARRSLYLGVVAAMATAVVVSFNGTRSTLLFPLLCALGIWVITRRRYRWLHLVAAFATLPVLSLLSGSADVLNMLIVRFQCLPAQLTAMYYDFARQSDPLLLRDTALYRWFGQTNPLGQDLPHFIGITFLHSPTVNANANIWAHAQVELRIVGPLVASLIAGGLLRLVDSIVAQNGTSQARLMAAGFCAYWALAWGNVALQTSLFSNGVIAALIILFLLPGAGQSAVSDVGPSQRGVAVLHARRLLPPTSREVLDTDDRAGVTATEPKLAGRSRLHEKLVRGAGLESAREC